MKPRLPVFSRFMGIAASALAHAPAAAQRLGQASENDISLWRVAGVLVLCLLLAFGAAWLLRARTWPDVGTCDWQRIMRVPAKGGRMTVVERCRLTPQSELAIVQVDGLEKLFSISPAGVQLVETLTFAISPEAPE